MDSSAGLAEHTHPLHDGADLEALWTGNSVLQGGEDVIFPALQLMLASRREACVLIDKHVAVGGGVARAVHVLLFDGEFFGLAGAGNWKDQRKATEERYNFHGMRPATPKPLYLNPHSLPEGISRLEQIEALPARTGRQGDVNPFHPSDMPSLKRYHDLFQSIAQEFDLEQVVEQAPGAQARKNRL